MSKQFWIIVVVIVVALVGIFALTGKKTPSTASSSAKASQHIEGQGKSGVTLVEYGDYECPYCGEYYPTVKQVQAEYNTQIFFQFRNFPLVNVHQNAFAGARAAEAAGLMGKFWEMHDLLYENQNQWSGASDPTPFFDQYAQQLGLNSSTFKQDYASGQVNDTINADTAAGNALNIQGTPSFFLDGTQIQVGNQVSAFEKLINAEIAKKSGNANQSNTTSAGITTQTKK